MRPKFLLDEHISRRVAKAASRLGVDARAVDGSDLAGLDDRSLFRAAIREGRILVTYNNGDFAPLLVDFAREGGAVPGVVFVNGDTLPTSDVGGLVRAIVGLAERIRAGRADPSGGIFLGRA